MSARIVAQEIVDEIPLQDGEKAGFVPLIAPEIIYYTIASMVACMQLQRMNADKASSTAEGSYDQTLNSFGNRELNQVRRQVRRAAQRKGVSCSPWQEIVTANAVLHKARSPQAVQMCLADTECVGEAE